MDHDATQARVLPEAQNEPDVVSRAIRLHL
jgi:hypothetical protein